MAAHRYWQALAMEAYGLTSLDISDFQLLAGTTRVDASATLTSSVAPATGSLANLQDDNTLTGATWPVAQVNTLVLSWDFGTGGGADVTDIRLGSSTDRSKFLLIAKLQYADTLGTWTDLTVLAGIAWPGARSKTTSVSGVISRNTVLGRATGPSCVAVASAMTVALPYGQTKTSALVKGRLDYLTGVLGAGIGRVSGTVKETGSPNAPVYRRVRLIRDVDGLLIREQWSNPTTGAYQFDYVDERQKYSVLSYDQNHNFRAVVADNLTPDLIS